jgi:hypothetical protein
MCEYIENWLKQALIKITEEDQSWRQLVLVKKLSTREYKSNNHQKMKREIPSQ